MAGRQFFQAGKERAMTAASPGSSGQNLFVSFSSEGYGLYRARREAFVFSLLGQALVVGLILCFTRIVTPDPGLVVRQVSKDIKSLLVYSGPGGGGGGTFDQLAASRGVPPRASLNDQLAPPTVIVPKEMPRLPVEQTVMVAPDVKLPQGTQIGDPTAPISKWLSNGPGGPGGSGEGCCGGVGPAHGPGVGPGPGGIHLAGVRGVTVPRVIYNPEPNFSDEARKSKTQGSVVLMLVVGADGRTYDISVQRSLGMGLDEKAIEAVRTWRFHPATLNGQPVAAQIAVEVNFHLY
jgi:TonB family protein